MDKLAVLQIAISMAATVLDSVPFVEIENGTFKYVLIEVKDGQDNKKLIARGYNNCEYHR